MKVNITKRYCYSQSYNWNGGGFAQAVQEIEQRRVEHPESELTLEVNKRSTTRVYRVVRYTQVEIEVPDMPIEADFEVPKIPKAKKLKPHEYTQSIDERESKDRWGSSRMDRALVLTHVSTDISVRHSLYHNRNVDKYSFGRALEQLEQHVDPTYEEKYNLYKERTNNYNNALAEWRKEVDAIYAEAKKEVVVA